VLWNGKCAPRNLNGSMVLPATGTRIGRLAARKFGASTEKNFPGCEKYFPLWCDFRNWRISDLPACPLYVRF